MSHPLDPVIEAGDRLLAAAARGDRVGTFIARQNLRAAQGWAAKGAAPPARPTPLDPNDRLGDFIRRQNARSTHA